MTLLVPFDGSPLAGAALSRASEWSDFADEDVVVLTVIPDDDDYARERGWIAPGEPFDVDAIADGMRDRAERIAPDAGFRREVRTGEEPTSTPTTTVVRTIRRVAADVDASVVFVGSENAGSVTAPLSSVGGPVASDQHYDVYVVRHPDERSTDEE